MINTYVTHWQRTPLFQAVQLALGRGHGYSINDLLYQKTSHKSQLEVNVKNLAYRKLPSSSKALSENLSPSRATRSIIFVLHVDQRLAHGSVRCLRLQSTAPRITCCHETAHDRHEGHQLQH